MKLIKLLFLLIISVSLSGCYTQIRHVPVNEVDYVVYRNVHPVYSWQYHHKPFYFKQYKHKKYYKSHKPKHYYKPNKKFRPRSTKPVIKPTKRTKYNKQKPIKTRR